MPRKLSSDEVAAVVTTNHEQMDNGELRLRLMRLQGDGYILTVAGEQSAWQNAHSHRFMREMIVVQDGWIASTALVAGRASVTIYEAGDWYVSEPNEPHNLFMPVGATVHCVKFGPTERMRESDWYAEPQLDALSKAITEAELLQMRAELGR